jgi:hypothetical protein
MNFYRGFGFCFIFCIAAFSLFFGVLSFLSWENLFLTIDKDGYLTLFRVVLVLSVFGAFVNLIGESEESNK